MNAVTVDWKKLEEAWCEAIMEAFDAIASAHPSEQIYVGAFWLLYGDYSSILPPAFGLNSEGGDPEVRWHPPDFRWSPIDEVHHRVQSLYAPLASLSVSEEVFDGLWEEHVGMLASVSRRVTALVRDGSMKIPQMNVTPDFFVGIIDFDRDEEAFDDLRRSVDGPTLERCGILELGTEY